MAGNPSIMCDGRHFTDYRSPAIVNAKIRGKMNTFEYRNFLIHNASDLIELNNLNAFEMNMCSRCKAQPMDKKHLFYVNGMRK